MITFGTYPTAIERLDDRLWIKRDDRVSAIYGGNKVRKLERLLGEARSLDKTRVLTMGAAGSHQVVATALYGAREGFSVEAVLVPQPSSQHARDNLHVALAHGLVPWVASSWAAAPAVVAAHLRRDKYFIPLGGSNAKGSLGFVHAARELALQVASGAMPEPDIVVVATGSGGTAAGLAVGFEIEQMRTRVLSIPISEPVRLLAAMARRLVKSTAALVGLSRARGSSAASRIDMDARWVGRGYGYPTAEGQAATRWAARAGIVLDATYTAKAFAAALASAGDDKTVLFWHTLSTSPLPLHGEPASLLPLPLLDDKPAASLSSTPLHGEPGAIPEELEALFR